jgi:3-deoxy-D-manno-octulosonate 8-phosphate phosphatase KdsC-like HAD superfamily phosphatase
LAACPADAAAKVKQLPDIKVLETRGGEGAVREFVDNHITYL